MYRLQEAQQQDLNSKDYKYRELTYILESIIKEFIKDFYKGLIQRYNKVAALVNRL